MQLKIEAALSTESEKRDPHGLSFEDLDVDSHLKRCPRQEQLNKTMAKRRGLISLPATSF